VLRAESGFLSKFRVQLFPLRSQLFLVDLHSLVI
jgi:hypothetical protein